MSIESTKPVWPRNDVKLTVTVKNIGDIPAPSPDCLVIIRQAHAPQQGIRTIRKSIRALEAGDRYTFTLPLKLGLGLYEVSAEVDRKKRIAESDETNNEARLTLEGK